MNAPAITVLMPVYNGEKYLREAIDSILNQTFKDFEFLIINDGSTDSTEQIILSYTDPRIRYVKNEANLKLIATLNKGFDLARGKYVVRTDADDTNHPDRLKLQYEFMEAHPEVGLLGTGFETFGENQPVKQVVYSSSHNIICFRHLYQIHLSHGTSIFRMSVVKQHQLYFDPAYAHAEDYELWTRFSAVSKLANIPQVLYRVRHHEHEVSKLHSDVQQSNTLRIGQNQFKKMGAALSPAEAELFIKLAHYEYEGTEAYIKAARSLLEKLTTANDKSGLIDKDFFRQQMGAFWFNVTYNGTAAGLIAFNHFNASVLSNYKPLSIIDKAKFFIKALLKR